MKALNLMVLASVMGFAAQGHSATLAASVLKCGGVVSVEQNRNEAPTLDVALLAGSTCDKIQVISLGLSDRLRGSDKRFVIRSALGNQLVVVVNDSEIVILTLGTASSTGNGGTGSGSGGREMSDYERRSLEIQEKRAARERAEYNAKTAEAAADAAGALGSALVDGAGQIER